MTAGPSNPLSDMAVAALEKTGSPSLSEKRGVVVALGLN